MPPRRFVTKDPAMPRHLNRPLASLIGMAGLIATGLMAPPIPGEAASQPSGPGMGGSGMGGPGMGGPGMGGPGMGGPGMGGPGL